MADESSEPIEMEFIELHNETLRGDVEAVRKLLDNGAEVDQLDQQHKTALMIACRHGELEIAELLMERGADIHRRSKELGIPVLSWSMGHKPEHTLIARSLLKRGADPNQADFKGWTPLMKAVLTPNMDIIDQLLHFGADKAISLVDGDGLVEAGTTAFDLAKFSNNPDLREKIAIIVKPDGANATPAA